MKIIEEIVQEKKYEDIPEEHLQNNKKNDKKKKQPPKEIKKREICRYFLISKFKVI